MNVSESIATLRADLDQMIGVLSRLQQTCLDTHATLSREFGAAQHNARADRDNADDWAQFLSELREAFGSDWFTVGQLAASKRYFTLPGSLVAIYERKRIKGLERAIGKAFRQRIGRRYGNGLHLDRRPEKHYKQAEWKIAASGTQAQSSAPSALIDRFIRERCEVAPDAFVRVGEFNDAYAKWHMANCSDPRPARHEIQTALRLRGYLQSRSHRIDGMQARTIEGIRLRRARQEKNQTQHQQHGNKRKRKG